MPSIILSLLRLVLAAVWSYQYLDVFCYNKARFILFSTVVDLCGTRYTWVAYVYCWTKGLINGDSSHIKVNVDRMKEMHCLWKLLCMSSLAPEKLYKVKKKEKRKENK